MLYNKGNHAQLKRVQPQPSRLQGENGGKIYSTWNPGKKKQMKSSVYWLSKSVESVVVLRLVSPHLFSSYQ